MIVVLVLLWKEEETPQHTHSLCLIRVVLCPVRMKKEALTRS
jgi:hypothetical protein